MRKNVLFFFSMVACLSLMMIGCKDKKPETIVVDEPEPLDTIAPIDTIVVADTVPVDAMDSLISATPMPKSADEIFDDFLFNFTANKKLQYERIKFPLRVVEGDNVTAIDRKEWQMEKFFMKQEFYTPRQCGGGENLSRSAVGGTAYLQPRERAVDAHRDTAQYHGAKPQ